MTAPAVTEAGWILVGQSGRDLALVELGADGLSDGERLVDPHDLPAIVAERANARWVWSDTARWYPALVSAGVHVRRCHDLRLCHTILRAAVPGSDWRGSEEWEQPATIDTGVASPTLFDLDRPRGVPTSIEAAAAEFDRQCTALAEAADPGRLRTLLAAESVGALLAAELHAVGLPWNREAHERILVETLGARSSLDGTPTRITHLRERIRDLLDEPALSIDSQPKLLRALHRRGILVESTSRWDLGRQEHPVIAPLLEYKTLMRLYTANGWAWLDEWVHDGRFAPVYVPGGVVTGRWASSGGGALQLPRSLRPAVRADPGWSLVIADVAQLEPRVLAAMSRDGAMADAARGADLYTGIVRAGAAGTRAEAKLAVLGAMYGATSGDSGRLLPRLRRTFPAAMALVDEAAMIGERGGVVSTWLGRTSPAPSEHWREAQAGARRVGATDADESRARQRGRDRGRFTRNFVVQGTAAEWALCWLGALRARLAERPGALRDRAHLAFFLHDEIIVHTPTEDAESVADAVRESAAEAGRLVFGGFPIDFPLDLRIGADAAKT